MEPMKQAPWLPGDRRKLWSFPPFQIRIEVWAQRISLLPVVEVNWECGMATITLGWLNLGLAFDYDFDPTWENSPEAHASKKLPENAGIK